MIRVHVQPGICGLESTIDAACEDGQMVRLEIESTCPNIKALSGPLAEVDGYSIAFSRFSESPVYRAAETEFKHAACPVPIAIVKAVEAACGLALPKNVEVTIERID